jgi:protein phosphatase
VATSTGLVRDHNQDSAYAGWWLYAVADGLGGHAAGEVASSITIRTLREYDSAAHPRSTMSAAIQDAGARVRAAVDADPALRGMGTTLTAMLFHASGAVLASIGDSRAYQLRDSHLQMLTEDHNLGRLVAQAAVSAELAPRLVRYIDGRPDRSPDLIPVTIRPGDRYLLCTDGLSGVIDPDSIRTALLGTPDPANAASRLLSLADGAGSPDNVTAVVIDVGAATNRPAAGRPVTAGAAVRPADASDVRTP